VRALEALLLARRETGARAGAIARWQTSHGLTPDGVCGPVTLAAMGLDKPA
jgi:murein L,D-transpeptidase YcbB/YkuD